MVSAEGYSETVMEEYYSPYGMEKLFGPDGYAKVRGACGDTMEVFLKLDEVQRVHMGFLSDGCIATVACGSMLSKMVRDRTVEEVLNMTEEDLISALGGLPDDHRHCATLTLDTMFKALLDLMTRNEHIRTT
ncbi:MAG: iron-sulfur cluster assembly scaffold protein [Candidatus Thermoplasmatota archaeon]|jgi:nitrogen fixation NifU-like protein|nr:iron-sulfur cluster assembly scaffold protein [Candidatus Thermoplasmatota archaeon]